MSDKQTPFVVVFPRGQLAAKDKERFTKAGVIAVEADDPEKVCQLQLSEPLRLSTTGITGDAIVSACLSALAAQEPHDGSCYKRITSTGLACHGVIKQLAASIAASTGKTP